MVGKEKNNDKICWRNEHRMFLAGLATRTHFKTRKLFPYSTRNYYTHPKRGTTQQTDQMD